MKTPFGENSETTTDGIEPQPELMAGTLFEPFLLVLSVTLYQTQFPALGAFPWTN
jgi:hypothetical protein